VDQGGGSDDLNFLTREKTSMPQSSSVKGMAGYSNNPPKVRELFAAQRAVIPLHN
jgi:hypothetical protein